MSYRNRNCNELRISNVDEEVILAGFIKSIRNMGFMTFIDLRDHFGITQIVLSNDFENEVKELTKESTIQIKGVVKERSNKNKNIDTGDIEIICKEMKLLGKCKANLPFEINDEYKNNKEDLRLEYRFLDLRNEEIHKNIVLRSKILKDVRKIMDEKGFVEIQTPIFANSSPEGARDYLIPSRLNPGEFYALPQAPQQFKQLLMVSGFDKYYQIAPCFRDEDPRADRSPCEFYQVDFEMSFAEEEDVLNVLESFAKLLFKNNTDKVVSEEKFIRIPYMESMEKYGSDKPDLRNPLINVNLTESNFAKNVPFLNGKNVYAIKCDKLFGRKEYDKIVQEYKDEGIDVAWVKFENSNFTGGLSKFINEEIEKEIREKLGIDKEDASIFVISDEEKLKAQKGAGKLRILLGEKCELIDENIFKFCFIIDFPMYELNDDGEIDFAHNPFSMPNGELETLENEKPLDIFAHQYDMVCNGYEIASGAVRNHDVNVMEKAFEICGYGKEEVKTRFKALYNAFQYGAPPHAGAALGLDRIVMLIAGTNNIREIIAFPKNSKARDLMMNSPSKVSDEQLKDLHIKLDI